VLADEFGLGSGISIAQMVRLRGVSHENLPSTLLQSLDTSGPVIQLGSRMCVMRWRGAVGCVLYLDM
jgi:hypothetical protein